MQFVFSKILQKLHQNKILGTVFLVDALLSFHYYLLIYINSSFLSNFFSPSQISVLYIIGSTITLAILLNISKILERSGLYSLIRYLIVAEMAATIGLAFTVSHTLTAIYFMVYLITIPIILFGFDILLESAVDDESKTGEIRTAYLTMTNTTVILSTLLVAWILTDGDYYKVYLLSLLFLIPLYLLMHKYFSNFTDGKIAHIKIKETIAVYLENKDLSNVHTAHLALQIFYAYMVIYMPVYLSKYIGFSWTEIGLIFTIMLLPFIIFELPVGWLADKKFGEKEIMTLGLVLMGGFTLVASFITIKSFLFWTVVLFMTRVGASLVEATTDSYFFKKVNKDDADTIALYRMSGPGAYIIAPIIATLSLQFLRYNHIFIILGALMIFACRYSLAITDTK